MKVFKVEPEFRLRLLYQVLQRYFEGDIRQNDYLLIKAYLRSVVSLFWCHDLNDLVKEKKS